MGGGGLGGREVPRSVDVVDFSWGNGVIWKEGWEGIIIYIFVGGIDGLLGVVWWAGKMFCFLEFSWSLLKIVFHFCG